MTFAGLDVHARSTHVAALEVASGELKRIRFGPGSEEVIAWLAALPQPVHGCYEAGPTGFALYPAAEQAGPRPPRRAPPENPPPPRRRGQSPPTRPPRPPRAF